jgi:hypothetical protein
LRDQNSRPVSLAGYRGRPVTVTFIDPLCRNLCPLSASVWDRYEVGVSVAARRIAGVTVHFITHDEVAFVIDRAGYERALFGWPYDAQGVEAARRQIARD